MIVPKTPLRRSINGALARTLGVRLTAASTRPLTVDTDWFARLLHFHRLLGRVSALSGDVVECGVADGSSLAILASLIVAEGPQRRLWGFDSWAGLPAPASADLGAGSIATRGMFAGASARRALEQLQAHGLSDRQIAAFVRLVPGLFCATLPLHRRPIALLHVDVDLYQSHIDCLTNLWPHVQTGGIVAFDEYGEPASWPGARQAVDGFFAARAGEATDLRRDDASGKWWLMKRR